ncbi:TetR/AcrR family transcriptional regulator C-terminal domain-containing protein [Streptomyces sp. AV19]|uniref:TetR/AcrR family transcriptional regulator C-terminal domain-containing protein n=1 Tax=Streptomyces sp. AV19 TaxID=2793068 RepID=UPI0018FEAA7A|nr:TetR/AcrR family transcriptional regulator C-terminal domain-containing protein [Streptomyces sp. AV19]MBH1935214.1 TetR/AcrR family transcriptional regulator C-terminal domain-containing protein [Streptomyces sp. AV19]MDG4531116.1 TetR/AcrR family transcriptional regulator C-terminal domain-containing protein [Streptomyces sp. AV19]
MTAPPYLRIADDIRRRIAAGDLAPGDRVPSTRRIARDWGVALATAARALTTLQQEGLIQARPRVGSVVAPREPAAPAADRDLTRERIVRAAVEIADAEGLGALSMRGVAARLGVATMSPYRYVDGKDALVLLMADAAFGEMSFPEAAPDGWRPRLELAARTLWSLYRGHPWLAHLGPVTRPLALPNVIAYGDWLLAALEGLGLDVRTRFDLHVLLYSHVVGLAAHLEGERRAEAATGLTDDEWMDRHAADFAALAASGRYPAFTKVIGELESVGGYDLRLDELFEFGLQRLLDGIAVRLGEL